MNSIYTCTKTYVLHVCVQLYIQYKTLKRMLFAMYLSCNCPHINKPHFFLRCKNNHMTYPTSLYDSM